MRRAQAVEMITPDRSPTNNQQLIRCHCYKSEKNAQFIHTLLPVSLTPNMTCPIDTSKSILVKIALCFTLVIIISTVIGLIFFCLFLFVFNSVNDRSFCLNLHHGMYQLTPTMQGRLISFRTQF